MENIVTAAPVSLDRAPGKRWVILIVNCFALLLFFMVLNIVPAYSTYVMAEWNLSNTQYGLITAMGFAGYAIASWVGGNLATKIGARKLLALCAVVLFLSVVFYPLVQDSYYPLLALRFVTGLGGAGMGVLTACTGQWFPSHERGFALGMQSGLLGLAFSIDALVAEPLLTLGFTWKQASAVFMGICCVVIGLLHFMIYRDVKDAFPGAQVMDDIVAPRAARQKSGSAPASKVDVPVADTWKDTAKSVGFISMTVNTICNMLVVFTMATYMPAILTDVLGFSSEAVNPVLATTFVATVISSPLGGVLSDKVFRGRRWQVCFISFALCAVCCATLPFIHNVALLSVWLFLTYGSVPLENGPVWDIPLQWSKPEFHTKFNGLVMLVGLMIGGVFGNVIIGAVIDITGSAMGALYTYIIASVAGMISSKLFRV